jgi:hypothetical protein
LSGIYESRLKGKLEMEKAKEGGYAGGRATFGYQKKKGEKELKIHNGQAEVVKRLGEEAAIVKYEGAISIGLGAIGVQARLYGGRDGIRAKGELPLAPGVTGGLGIELK